MSKDMDNSKKLLEYSKILFRHFKWIENECIKHNVAYNYDRNQIPVKVDTLKTILNDIANRLKQLELSLIDIDNRDLSSRISNDIEYILYSINNITDEEVTSFDMNMSYKDIKLSQDATDALTFFLFEESYKEYELIMIYNYLKAHTKSLKLANIFETLIEESFFHFGEFAGMMSEMGILGVPRVIAKELYLIDNITEFLLSGIDEELAAKEECKKLSDAVGTENKELSKFFDFISNQENYHIALMKEALESLGYDNV
jgi:rubrerythrin